MSNAELGACSGANYAELFARRCLAVGQDKSFNKTIEKFMKMAQIDFYCAARMMAAILLLNSPMAFAQTPQQHVHAMSHTVMPFDMSKTIHIFKMTDSGGVEQIVVRNPHDADQITLIRRHLEREARMFQRGDYSDPAKLHGSNMPGLKELEAHASQIEVSYSALPQGAQITFKTTSLRLLTAIHRWFGAQLSEHGADAKAE